MIIINLPEHVYRMLIKTQQPIGIYYKVINMSEINSHEIVIHQNQVISPLLKKEKKTISVICHVWYNISLFIDFLYFLLNLFTRNQVFNLRHSLYILHFI